MRKMDRSVSFVLIILTALAGITCKQNIGLGGTIDIERPTGAITYPNAGETPIRGSFVIKGWARDDKGVHAISVRFKNKETGTYVGASYSAEPFQETVETIYWKINIKNEWDKAKDDPNHPLVKCYPISDGEYEALVTLTDKQGRTTVLNQTYKIDNTPPVFIVSRPSTIATSQDSSPVSEPYGAVFTVVGQAEDKNKIEDLTLKVDGTDISVSKKFVGKNINEQMAEAIKDSGDNYTDKLYLYNHRNPNQKIKAHLFLTDNARFYKGDEPEGPGNTSEWYYLRDKEMRSVLAQGYTADIINDYFAGKRGSALSLKKSERLLASLYDTNNTEAQSVKRILENSLISTVDSSEKYSVFTLNPDKSPGFKISGATNLPIELSASTPDPNLPKPSRVHFQDGTGPTLILDLIGNRDEKPLVENYADHTAYNKSKIVINLYKCNEVSYTDSGSVKKLNLQPEISPEHSFKFEDLQAQDLMSQGGNPAVVDYGGSHKLTVSWQLPANFKQGYYLVKVEGKDTDGNDFVAYNNNNSAGGVYVINFKLIGNALMISPEEPSGYIRTDFVVRANVFNLSTNPKVRYKIDTQAGESDTPLTLKTGSGTEYESASIQVSSVSEGTHVVHFWANDDKGQEVKAKKEFIKDTTPPVPEMTYPSKSEDQMGTIRIGGSVSDDGAGVKAEGTKFIIGKRDSLPGYDSPDWKPMDKSNSASWEFTYNLDNFSSSLATCGEQVGSTSVYKIPVYILTEDKIGNKKVTTETIRFDSDGNKPVMTIQSPHQDQVLGGAIQIFGTGTTRLGGAGSVGKVYIQFSKTGSFDSQDDGTFGVSSSDYDSDWYKDGKGQMIPGTNSGGASWQITVNKNGEFNSTDPAHQNRNVYFRVRALKKGVNPDTATAADWGLWTSPVKITVDKAYPTVGSPDPLKIVNTDDSAPENYIQDMWIKEGKKLTGSLYDESGIKELTISSSELLGSLTYSLQRALSEGWIVEDTARAPNPATGAQNYKLQIPLTIKDSMKRQGNLSIKIRIVENTPKELYSETTLRMRFDVTKPAAAGGKWIVKSEQKHISQGKFTVSPALDSAKKERYRVLVDDKVYEVDSLNGTQVTLKNASSLTGSFNYGIVERPVMVYDDGSDYQITGIAADTVTGVKEVKATLKVSDTETSVTMTRNDGANKITQERGDMVSFQGSLDTDAVKNGKGTLTITAEDYQGNTVSEEITNVIVKNKPVKITKLVFKTDLSGNNDYEENEEYKIENFGNLNADKDFRGTKDIQSEFTFKNSAKSEIVITLEGGKGTNRTVKLYKDSVSQNTLVMEKNAAPNTITLNLENEFGADDTGVTPHNIKIDDADDKKLIIQVFDDKRGADADWCAQANITVGVDAVDGVEPTGFIMPFFYNSDKTELVGDEEKLSSVKYEGGKPAGHIEISEISSLGNNHPCVSGKVMLRGIAYDNIRLKKLELSGAGISGVSADFSGGSWTSATGLNVKTSKFSNTGHYVEWEYEWTTGTPALAQTVTLAVTDAANKTNAAEKTEPVEKTGTRNGDRGMTLASDINHTAVKHQFIRLYEKVNNKEGEKSYLVQVDTVSADGKTVTWKDTSVPEGIKNYRLYDKTSNNVVFNVNIVPYITGVSRNSTYNTNRARSGAVPLLRGEAGNTLTGFNFADGSETSLKITENKNGSGSELEMADLTLSGSSFTFKVPDTAKDGYLHLVVNGVAAVNNINTYTASNTEKSDTYGAKEHSDDRFVHIWRVSKEDTFKGSKNAIYPAMTKDSNGKLYASFSNYSKSDVYYSNQFTGDTPVAVAVDGNGTRKVLHVYDPPEETDIIVNGTEVNVLYAANYHNGSAKDWGNGTTGFPWNDTGSGNAGGIYLYDKDAPKIYRDYKGYRFELFTYDNELQQFKNIRTVRSGDNIYVVYYDRLTAAAKFAWVDDSKTPDTSSRALPWCVIDGNTDVTDTHSKVPDAPETAPDGQKKFTFVSPNNSEYKAPYVLNNFEDSLSVSSAVWESIALTVTTQGFPVVVYMDATTGSLRLARSTKLQPTAPADWTIQKVLAASDPNGKIASDYINACIGSDGILHIAFQNTRGQLVYVKSTNTSDTGSAKYKFGTSEVLDDSGTFIEMTMDGTMPYITYMSRPNSYDAIRIAYKTSMDFNNTGTNVEGWETMTAPLNERATNSRICIETQAKHYNATGTMPVAVGFKTNSDYRAAFYVGK